MNAEITADDIRDGMKDAPLTCQYLAQLLNAKNYARAGQILEEQATYVKDFRRMLDNNRNVEQDAVAR